MATQITGGGLWFWDPDDDPDSPWRGEGVPEDELEHPYGGVAGSLANQLGYTGDGVTIAVSDYGFHEHDDYRDRIDGAATYDDEEEEWIQGMEYMPEDGHGTFVTGVVAGNYSGTEMTVPEWLVQQSEYDIDEPVMGDYYAGQGAAPESSLYLQEGFPDDPYEIPENAAQESDAYVHTNSWGSSNEYDDYSSAYDEAVRDSNKNEGGNEPMIITVAIGNYGVDQNGYPKYGTAEAPAIGKNVIGVGGTETFNVDLQGEYDYFYSNPEAIYHVEGDPEYYRSALGRTDDDRIKPDVVAPGESIIGAYQEDQYRVGNGTSYATPNVAGSTAVVVQWYEEKYGFRPSPAMVKALLINTAVDLDLDGLWNVLVDEEERYLIVERQKELEVYSYDT